MNKFKLGLNFTANAVAVAPRERLQSFKFNAIQVSCVVGGAGHLEADFAAHKLQVNIRRGQGSIQDQAIIDGCNILGFLKLEDWRGGFSADFANGANGRYVLLIPMGQYYIQGDDQIEVSMSLPGDATATYAYRVNFVQARLMPEKMIRYKSYTSGGNPETLKDVSAAYLLSDADGSTIEITYEDGTSENLYDYDIQDFANAVGEIETYEEFGVIFEDDQDKVSDITVRVPSGKTFMAVFEEMDPARLAARQSVLADELAARQSFASRNNPKRLEVWKLRKEN